MAIRLLDTTTLDLKTFIGRVPEYAILSHTWDGDKEVSFQDMTCISRDPKHPAKKKSGYRKILDTCNNAKSHGFQYVWIDTCCIDKTSSSELSEAINSMFKWYQNAKSCYVYLIDLPEDFQKIESLQYCRWFTRGWCLQELLAPKDLTFYDELWNYVGSKAELSDLISRITGINKEVLDGVRPLHSITVAQRMAWAERRSTTRVEDIAYCLLGIFDINMSMLYGEGEKAFARLQEEIIRRSNDLSIFCHPKTSSPESIDDWVFSYQDLFARSPRDFKTCSDITEKADSLLRHAFELTNNGLHFKHAEFKIREVYTNLISKKVGCTIYTMSLRCFHRWGRGRTMLNCEIFLKKVGPGIFVRLSDSPMGINSVPPMVEVGTVVEEAYIVPNIHPDVFPTFDRSHDYAIRFTSQDVMDLRASLEEPIPREQWDAPDLKFLTFGDKSFLGHVKFFPDFADSASISSATLHDQFHIACGLETTEFGEVCGAWVRLFSEEEWGRIEKRRMLGGLKYIGKFENGSWDSDFKRDELRVGEMSIRATIKETNKRLLQAGFDIEVSFLEMSAIEP